MKSRIMIIESPEATSSLAHFPDALERAEATLELLKHAGRMAAGRYLVRNTDATRESKLANSDNQEGVHMEARPETEPQPTYREVLATLEDGRKVAHQQVDTEFNDRRIITALEYEATDSAASSYLESVRAQSPTRIREVQERQQLALPPA